MQGSISSQLLTLTTIVAVSVSTIPLQSSHWLPSNLSIQSVIPQAVRELSQGLVVTTACWQACHMILQLSKFWRWQLYDLTFTFLTPPVHLFPSHAVGNTDCWGSPFWSGNLDSWKENKSSRLWNCLSLHFRKNACLLEGWGFWKLTPTDSSWLQYLTALLSNVEPESTYLNSA